MKRIVYKIENKDGKLIAFRDSFEDAVFCSQRATNSTITPMTLTPIEINTLVEAFPDTWSYLLEERRKLGSEESFPDLVTHHAMALGYEIQSDGDLDLALEDLIEESQVESRVKSLVEEFLK